MPKRIPTRCAPDSIQEFRQAARQRFREGGWLAVAGHRTGAIYLWGYAAEMTLKAAYFGVIGLSATQPIGMTDLLAAAANAPRLGVLWPGPRQFHDVRAWADLLVATRNTTHGLGYPDPRFGEEVRSWGRLLQEIWRETLRYHRNVAYAHEAEHVRSATAWLLTHSPQL